MACAKPRAAKQQTGDGGLGAVCLDGTKDVLEPLSQEGPG